MMAQRRVGLDLPMKLLIWEDEAGVVRVAYNDATYVATRHSLHDQQEIIGKVKLALAGIAAETTGTSPP